MEIKYLGHSSFLIRSKDAKLIIDPFDSSIGIKFPKSEADIVAVTHQHIDHNASGQIQGNPLIIDMPGEYEKKGVRIFGYRYFHDKKKGLERGGVVLYKIETEGISILHCGDLGAIPEDSLVDQIDGIDILMLPVGGTYTIDSAEAMEVIKKFEPSIILPMHFNSTSLNQNMFGKLAPLSDFLKKMGAESIIPIPKLVVKKDQLIEEMKVVLLEV